MASVEEVCDHIALINKSEKILDGKVSEIKEQFKTNVFNIVFEGDFNKFSASLTADYQLLENVREKNRDYVKVRILNDLRPNELLKKMLAYGTIVSFNEEIPSMQSVFIQSVNATN